MLNFFPAIYPWSWLYTDMTEQLPVGSFYSYSNYLLPRSVSPSEFWLVTDRYSTVRITINGKPAGTVNPSSQVTRLKMRLYNPPTANDIRVENGIDAPVFLKVFVTHMAKELAGAARELYEYAGRTNEHYGDLLSSPWTSFIADYQLPWRSILPNIRPLRIFSVKMLANTLFGESGEQGGVLDLVSAFTSTTPVVMEPRNPLLWQPDLYQPITSGQDNYGFEFHVWTPNICLVKWAAFIKLRNNTNYSFQLIKVSEDVVTVTPYGTTSYEQHLMNNLAAGCSVYDTLISLGCMDTIAAVGKLNFLSRPALCAYAEPFGRMVEPPGIGGRFFDSGPVFDSGVTFDDIYDIDILTDYWAGTYLVKTRDLGLCFGTYPTTCLLPEDTACCTDAPDTVLLTTTDCATSVTSAVTPYNPLFGGDTPGLLENPYFNVLA